MLPIGALFAFVGRQVRLRRGPVGTDAIDEHAGNGKPALSERIGAAIAVLKA